MGIENEVEKAKTAVNALCELGEAKKDATVALKDTCIVGEATEKLCSEGNKSKLIQVGMALMIFPEPTPVSLIAGAGLLAVGGIQKGIQNRAIYLEDIGKTLKATLKEVAETKNIIQT